MLPINHLKRTLDRCCGQWEFVDITSRCFAVRFLNTDRRFLCLYWHQHNNWEAYELHGEEDEEVYSAFLASRLNGLTRDDSGNHLPADFECVPGAV